MARTTTTRSSSAAATAANANTDNDTGRYVLRSRRSARSNRGNAAHFYSKQSLRRVHRRLFDGQVSTFARYTPTGTGRSGLLEISIRFPFPLPNDVSELLLREYNRITAEYGVEEFDFTTTANVIVCLPARAAGESDTFDLYYGMGYEDPVGAGAPAGSHIPCTTTPLHHTFRVDSADDVAEVDLAALSAEQIEGCFEGMLSEKGSSVVVTDVVNLVCVLRSYLEGREHVGRPRVVRLT